eukprot:snap_masked-scaffold_32-processed-gene-0.15-mRNA-1 protein AED:1.00 eAED:1.00 QI:0/-1/0/0/-1/1/1/0/105
MGRSKVSSESKVLDNVSKEIILSRDIQTLRRSITNLKQGNKIKNDEDKYTTEQRENQREPPSTYQEFLRIRKQPDDETPEHWIQRRNPHKATRPITYKLAKKTSN